MKKLLTLVAAFSFIATISAFAEEVVSQDATAPAAEYYHHHRHHTARFCASEGGYCHLAHRRAIVYYGTEYHSTERLFHRIHGVECTNRVFGDPAPGRRKECWVRFVD